MVQYIRLKKRRISQRGAGTKYYIDCSKYSENADSIQPHTLMRNTNHVAILKAVFADNTPKKNKHIVVKIVRSNKSAAREFDIGQQLYDNKLIGFIKYTCLFSCYDNTNEDNKEITAREPAAKVDSKICQAQHNETNLKQVIVMPYIQKGSIEDFAWNAGNVNILKNILIQAVLSLSIAYDAIGFLHGDLHLGNVLFIPLKTCNGTSPITTSEESTIEDLKWDTLGPISNLRWFKETKLAKLTYFSSNLGEISIETEGHKVVLMDFEKSETNVEKSGIANASFWDNIYMMLNRVNTLSPNNGERINWEDREIIRFLKEAKKRKYPCIKEHIVRLHEMMEKSEFEFFAVRECKYVPDDLY